MTARRLGIAAAIVALVLDQGNKLWLLDVYDIATRQPLQLLPGFDIVFARNPGISYSLFSATTPVGRWSLVGVTALAILALGAWLWTARTRLTSLGLGLIVGGAVGNAIDRFAYGYVADFYWFHIGTFSWYVFNVADVAICLGVALIGWEALSAAPSRTPAAPTASKLP